MIGAMRLLILSMAVFSLGALSLLSTNPAEATQPGSTTEETETVSSACLRQVEQIVGEEEVAGESPEDFCTATISVTESAPHIATTADVRAVAIRAGFGTARVKKLVRDAAAGKVQYRDWTHHYFIAVLDERHAGRTFWDGSRAWVTSYRGLAGSHHCHTEGGYAVGWAVKPGQCTNPSAGRSADSSYRFDASLFVKGSPVTLDIGLHYSVSSSGSISTWQVGG